MKKVALIASILILVAIGSLWLGYHIRNPALIRRGYCVAVTCGGGDYPNEAFIIVNDELGDKIDEMGTDKLLLHFILIRMQMNELASAIIEPIIPV